MSTIIIRITGTASQVSGQLGKLIAEHGPNTTIEELKKYKRLAVDVTNRGN